MQTQSTVCRNSECHERLRSLRSVWAAWAGAVFVVGGWAVAARGQETPAAPAKPAGEVRQLGGYELLTKDGVALRGEYYVSSEGKKAVPVVLLHSHKSSREEFQPLAKYLQSRGHAVLLPDLRGHGLSTRLGVGTVTRKLDAREQKLAPGDFTAMAIQDMEAIKRFLVQENNAGKLNIEKLCLVGSEMGASVALNWAAYDWSWPVYPGLKQGQFAKGLVLMSPPWAFPGLGIGEAMKSPALHQQISVMVLVGKENEKAMRDATRVHSLLQKSRAARNARIQEDAEQLKEQKDLFFKGFDTELQGGRLLAVRMNPPVHEFIGTFIQLRLVDKDYPWLEVSRKKETSEK